MESHGLFGFFILHLASTGVCKLGSPGGPMKLNRDVTDGFKTIEEFPYAVAISDSDNDTVFECLAAKRLGFDPQTRTGIYEFLLPSSGQVLLFYARPGNSPNSMILTSDI
ncbi:hypothetical protein MTO96_042779, partial [Rhipicephalus appendiculatus]